MDVPSQAFSDHGCLMMLSAYLDWGAVGIPSEHLKGYGSMITGTPQAKEATPPLV